MRWYCDFYRGTRCPDDERQIKRWKQTAGPHCRFRRALINIIKRRKQHIMSSQLVQHGVKHFNTGDMY